MKRKMKLILEFTEFQANRMNPDSAQMSVQVDNPSLSINAFDKHEDAIRSGIARINTILHALSGSSAYRSLKSKLILDEQKITSMKVLRLVDTDSVNWDAYISFVIGEEEYYGQIKNLLSPEPQIKSEVFKDFDLVQSKEWILRTKGLLLKAVLEWLHPEDGTYQLLNDFIICADNLTGQIIKIEKDSKVEVVNSYDNKIIIRYNDKNYTLSNKNFVYFNYWFLKV
jgi:hypothetical protein